MTSVEGGTGMAQSELDMSKSDTQESAIEAGHSLRLRECDPSMAACMLRAIELAKLGGGWVDPNPQVGCVMVKDGDVIGEGYHHAFGKPHAEREALADCIVRGNDPEGATVFVTLEPCSHHGKTPPCADALVEARVGRVVIGSRDPNPLVAGKGAARLEAAGIVVIQDFMREECDALNAPFFHYISAGLPLVIAKYAMTLDGMFSTVTGKSRWITGEAARRRVHEDRARYAAIMVGVGTVIADDPMLNVRLGSSSCDNSLSDKEGSSERPLHQPARIILDSHLRTPLDSKLVRTACEQRTIIVTTECSPEAQRPYLERCCEVIALDPEASTCSFDPASSDLRGRVDLVKAIAKLGEEGIDSIILEGGRTLMSAAFEAGIVNKVQTYIAPKVFGNVDEPADAAKVVDLEIETIGPDILIEGDVV